MNLDRLLLDVWLVAGEVCAVVGLVIAGRWAARGGWRG